MYIYGEVLQMKQFEYQDELCRGTLRRLDYVGLGGNRKYAMIYRPYGYDEASDRRYNIFYMVHGGNGNPDSWLDSCPMKNVLDHCFAAGEAEPMIVVYPTFYADGPKRPNGAIDEAFERGSILRFQQELVELLIPAVEGGVRGYAEGTEPEELRRVRTHRGVGGFSMGGSATWYSFSKCPEYFSVFLPLSGDSWELEIMGGRTQPEETARRLRECMTDKGFGPEDFNIFAATGTEDIAYPNLTPQIEAMRSMDDFFRFSEAPERGNLHYLLGEGMYHTYDTVCQYFYNWLPFLF